MNGNGIGKPRARYHHIETLEIVTNERTDLHSGVHIGMIKVFQFIQCFCSIENRRQGISVLLHVNVYTTHDFFGSYTVHIYIYI